MQWWAFIFFLCYVIISVFPIIAKSSTEQETLYSDVSSSFFSSPRSSSGLESLSSSVIVPIVNEYEEPDSDLIPLPLLSNIKRMYNEKVVKNASDMLEKSFESIKAEDLSEQVEDSDLEVDMDEEIEIAHVKSPTLSSPYILFLAPEHPRYERILYSILLFRPDVKQNIEMVFALALELFSVTSVKLCKKKLMFLSSQNKLIHAFFRTKSGSLDSSICKYLLKVLNVIPGDLPVQKNGMEYEKSDTIIWIPSWYVVPDNSHKWDYIPKPRFFNKCASLAIEQPIKLEGSVQHYASLEDIAINLDNLSVVLNSQPFKYMDDIRAEVNEILESAKKFGVDDPLESYARHFNAIRHFNAKWFMGSSTKCSLQFFVVSNLLESFYRAAKYFKGLSQKKLSHNPRVLLDKSIIPYVTSLLKKIRRVSRLSYSDSLKNSMFIVSGGAINSKIGAKAVFSARDFSLLSILQLLDVDFAKVKKLQRQLKKCLKRFAWRRFKKAVRKLKRHYREFKVAIEEQSGHIVETPIDSPLYIKGRKFGIKYLFRKDAARKKHGYYNRSSGRKKLKSRISKVKSKLSKIFRRKK